MKNKISAGVSLFSMGGDYALGRRSVADCIRLARAIGFDGIELVSAQMVPGYPHPSEAWCQEIISVMKACDIEPVAYGSYVDMARYSDHDLCENEIYAVVRDDMLTAHKLGFKILKVNDLIGVHVLERLMPLAEYFNMWIGVEFHQPNVVGNSTWKPYFELFERVGSSYTGVVPDTGIFLERAPEIFEGEVKPPEHQTSMEDFAMMLKYSKYMHGKFFYMNEQCEDTAIDFGKIMAVVKKSGFSGYINAEYEGWFHDLNLDAEEQLRRYYRMIENYIR